MHFDDYDKIYGQFPSRFWGLRFKWYLEKLSLGDWEITRKN